MFRVIAVAALLTATASFPGCGCNRDLYFADENNILSRRPPKDGDFTVYRMNADGELVVVKEVKRD